MAEDLTTKAEPQVKVRRDSSRANVVRPVNERTKIRKKIASSFSPSVRVIKIHGNAQGVRVRFGKTEGKFVVVGSKLVPLVDRRVAREIQQVRDRLLEIMKPDAAERWIYAPLDSLGGRSPREAIEAGDTERVLELIAAVAYGIHS